MEHCKAQKLRKKKIQGWKQKVQIVLREKIAWGENQNVKGGGEKIREEMNGATFRRKIKG